MGGHAAALARCQRNEVSFVIHNLPVIQKMSAVSKAFGSMFGLNQGESSECCGGLLVSLPREQAATYCKDLERLEGYPSWIIEKPRTEMTTSGSCSWPGEKRAFNICKNAFWK